jgi:hypothetical protein
MLRLSRSDEKNVAVVRITKQSMTEFGALPVRGVKYPDGVAPPEGHTYTWPQSNLNFDWLSQTLIKWKNQLNDLYDDHPEKSDTQLLEEHLLSQLDDNERESLMRNHYMLVTQTMTKACGEQRFERLMHMVRAAQDFHMKKINTPEARKAVTTLTGATEEQLDAVGEQICKVARGMNTGAPPAE